MFGEQSTLMPRKHFVTFSGGKDSAAMLFRMLELGMPVDEVVFAETTFEFPEIYDYIRATDNRLIKHGLKVRWVDRREVIRAQAKTPYNDQYGNPQVLMKGELDRRTFDDWFKGKPRSGFMTHRSRGWMKTHTGCMWMREAKYKPLIKVVGNNYSYIGFAAEEKRTMKALPHAKFPLKEWWWTEPMCVKYLEKNGLLAPPRKAGGCPEMSIHKRFRRTGCYLCPYQSTRSLRTIYECYPELWKVIKAYDEASEISIKPKVTLADIEAGLKINGKDQMAAASRIAVEGE